MTYPDFNRIPVNRNILSRFFSKIKISTQHSYNNDPCWEWTAHLSEDGYGFFSIGSVIRGAHRYAYQFFVATIPDSTIQCDHLCRVRHCVNPAHLELVTNKENCLRGISFAAVNAQKTHCPQGHLYNEINTIKRAKDRRGCYECKRINGRLYMAKKRALRTPEEKRRVTEQHQQWMGNGGREKVNAARRKRAAKKRLEKEIDHVSSFIST